MKVDAKTMAVYAVTDSAWLKGRALAEDVERALLGGATFVQLREKALDTEDFIKLAQEVKQVVDRFAVPFVINDSVEVAMAVDADGVHVGQKDMEAGDVRQRLGADKIIGVSVQNCEQALLAEAQGADYLGVGAMFATGTKLDASEVSFEELKNICEAVSIPVVAIGGINEKNIQQLKGIGADGVAVVSAIFAAEDITQATQSLVKLVGEMLA